MTLSREVAAQIESLIGHPENAGRHAVVLGRSAERWAAPLRGRGYEVSVEVDPSNIDRPPGSASLIVAADVLGEEEWDRWALQQAHRILEDGGRLVLTAPGFYALGIPSGIAFLLGRVPREIGLRVRRAFKLSPPRERFGGRRYRLSSLLSMLETLGFAVDHRTAHDFGWLAPLAGLGGRDRVAGTFVLRCRRAPSLFGLDPRRPFPAPDSHRRRFERTHRRFVEDRERWLARHPRYRPSRIAELDPTGYRGARVLVLAPHPDDELIGCGGTLARLIGVGARVTVLHATDGSEAASLWHAPEATRRTVRLGEAHRVGEAMGFEELILWHEDNAAFRERDERVGDLVRLVEETRPALIFTPFVTDVHADHRVLSRMLARAIAAAPEASAAARVLAYQVWSLAPCNVFCDVSEVMECVERLLFAYPTAMKSDDYVHRYQDRNYYDAVTLAGRKGYVEGFFQTEARDYPAVPLDVSYTP